MTTATMTRHDGLLDLTDRLIVEYRGALPAGAVMRCVARTHHQLVAAGLGEEAPQYTEEVTRRRLTERVAQLGYRGCAASPAA